MSKNIKILILILLIFSSLISYSLWDVYGNIQEAKLKEQQEIDSQLAEVNPTEVEIVLEETDYNDTYTDRLTNVLDEESMEDCNDLLQKIIVGKWRTGPSEYLDAPIFQFFEDGTFAESTWESQDQIVDGKYNLDTKHGALILVYNDLDNDTEAILLRPDVYDIFPGLLEYSIEKDSIALSINYLPEMNTDFDGECHEDSFVINYFGNFLFQSEYVPF